MTVQTFDTWIEDTQDEYRKGPLNDAQRKKYAPKRRIWRLKWTSQEDAEETGAERAWEGTACGFCNKWYNGQN